MLVDVHFIHYITVSGLVLGYLMLLHFFILLLSFNLWYLILMLTWVRESKGSNIESHTATVPYYDRIYGCV